jgi:uncharacterized membrane protein YeaQ/YmgE (transglycosylase-associated protein family)
MFLLHLILFLAIGILAGYLAGRIMKGRGFGTAGDLVVGVVGAVLGGWLFRLIGISTSGLVGELLTALVGAVVLLYIVRLIKKV